MLSLTSAGGVNIPETLKSTSGRGERPGNACCARAGRASCHHPLRTQRQSEALPPGKRVSAFWMRASTMPTTWMEETEAKSSCTGSLRGRSGGGIREGFWGINPFCAHLAEVEPKKCSVPPLGSWRPTQPDLTLCSAVATAGWGPALWRCCWGSFYSPPGARPAWPET